MICSGLCRCLFTCFGPPLPIVAGGKDSQTGRTDFRGSGHRSRLASPTLTPQPCARVKSPFSRRAAPPPCLQKPGRRRHDDANQDSGRIPRRALSVNHPKPRRARPGACPLSIARHSGGRSKPGFSRIHFPFRVHTLPAKRLRLGPKRAVAAILLIAFQPWQGPDRETWAERPKFQARSSAARRPPVDSAGECPASATSTKRSAGLCACVAALLLVALFPVPAQAAPLYGETYLVSTSHEDGLFGPESEFTAISKDGSHAFWTTSESLLSADSDNDNFDIYERNVDARTTRLVTPGGDFDATFLGSSEDGSKVFFATEEPIVGDSDAKRRHLPAQPGRRTADDDEHDARHERVRPVRGHQPRRRPALLRDQRVAQRRRHRRRDRRLHVAERVVDADLDREQGQRRTSPARPTTRARRPTGCTSSSRARRWLTDDDDGRHDEYTCRTGYNDEGTPDIFGWSGGSVTNFTAGRAAASATSAPPARATGSRPPRRTARASSSTRRTSSPRTMAIDFCVDDLYESLGAAITMLSPSQ